MRVRIFRDWRPSYKCDFDYKDMKFVEDDSYEYAILMNLARPNLRIPKEKVIGFAWEPSSIKNFRSISRYVNDRVGAYIIGDPRLYGSSLGNGFIEYHSFMYDLRPTPKGINKESPFYKITSSYDVEPKKKFPMCIIASNKNFLLGHKKRHDLISRILRTNMNIHVYGRSIAKSFKDERVKGAFKLHPDVYPNYFFDISIENCQEGSYITEKLFYPVSHKTCPIYWGSSKVRKYCRDFFFDLPTNNDEAMDVIKDIYDNYEDRYNQKKTAIETSSIKVRQYNYLDFAREYFITHKIPNFII